MSDWWYVVKNKNKGPVTTEEVKGLLLSGEINEKTLFWKEGMEEWKQLKDTESLQDIPAQLPPPIPSKPLKKVEEYPAAGAFRRFFARLFDFWFESTLLVAIFYFIPPEMLYGLWGWMELNNLALSVAVPIMLMPVLLILDSIIHKLFGNTPGKALLGIFILDSNAKRLSGFAHFGRNLYVWGIGMAFFIPLIALLTMGYQGFRISKGKRSTYDEKLNYRVLAKSPGWLKPIIFVVLLMAMVVGLNTHDKYSSFHDFAKTPAKANGYDFSMITFPWTNPISNRIIEVSGYWETDVELIDTKIGDIHRFTASNDKATILYSTTELDNHTIEKQIELTIHHALEIDLDDSFMSEAPYDIQHDKITGSRYWYGEGELDEQEGIEARIFILENKQHVWTVISIYDVYNQEAWERTIELERELVGSIPGTETTYFALNP